MTAAPAAAATLSGKLTDGRVAAGAAGVSSVSAVDVRTGSVVSATQARASGAWTLRVPDGAYVVAASVVRRHAAPVRAITPIVRVRGKKRATVKVSLRRKKAPRRAHGGAISTEMSHIPSPPGPIVAVKAFAGSGPEGVVAPGISEMLITDLVAGDGACQPKVVEWMRRAEMQAEIDLSNSGFGDPATRVHKNWWAPTVFVEGSIATRADGSASWDLVLKAADGTVMGGDQGSIPAGGSLFEAEQQMAGHLLDQICGAGYDVGFSLRTDAILATHDSAGTLNAVLTASGKRPKNGNPPTTFTGTVPLGYAGVTFTPKIDCAYISPVSVAAVWRVTLTVTPAGRLSVTWGVEGPGQGPSVTASVLCADAPAIPGQPGPSLVNPLPTTFEMPVTGGQQAISGGVLSGGQGFAHSGTITIARRP